MIKFISRILVFTLCMTTTFTAMAWQKSGKKVLIAYFSWSGNTRIIANEIQAITGGELFEIQSEKAYPADYYECTAVAKKEQQEKARPALKAQPKDMEEYDVVYVGFPNWWGSLPMPVVTFLETYDWKGKTLVPFVTHGGGGEQQCFLDFDKYAGNAKVEKGFICNGSRVNSMRPEIEKWLNGNN